MSILEKFRRSSYTKQEAKPAAPAPAATRSRQTARPNTQTNNVAVPKGELGTPTKQPERFLQPYYAVDIGKTTYQLPLAIVLTQGALGLEAMLYANDLYDYTEPLADRGKKLILVSHQISSYLRERGSVFKAHYEEGRGKKTITHEAKDDKFTEYYALANLVQKFGNERGTQYIREAEKQAASQTTIDQILTPRIPEWKTLSPDQKNGFISLIRKRRELDRFFLDGSSSANAIVDPRMGNQINVIKIDFRNWYRSK